MTKGHEPICMHCKHLRPTDPDKDGWSCDAYPYGIPDEIIAGWFIHNVPLPNDQGIQFEPMDGSDRKDQVTK